MWNSRVNYINSDALSMWCAFNVSTLGNNCLDNFIIFFTNNILSIPNVGVPILAARILLGSLVSTSSHSSDLNSPINKCCGMHALANLLLLYFYFYFFGLVYEYYIPGPYRPIQFFF